MLLSYNNSMKLKKILGVLLCSAAVPSLLNAAPVYAEETENTNEIIEQLISDYAFAEDPSTGQILLDKDSTEIIYPASMTKMMTVLLGIENLSNLNERVQITYQMLSGLAEANASVMGLYAGDLPTVEDLLYGAALPSGADACNAIAFQVSGGINAFVDLMNEKAAEIGMKNTHFVNPTGLHDDNHYTTCRDMALLMEYGLQNETFRTIFSAESYTTSSLASSVNGITCYSTSKSAIRNQGYDIPGFTGAKTGFTYEAGHCMTSWSELNGMELIVVTAHGDTGYYDYSHLDDAETILQYFSGWERKELFTSGQLASTITVNTYKGTETIEVCTFEDLTLDIPSDKEIVLTTTFPEEVDAELDERFISGSIILKAGDEVLYSSDIAVKIPKETSLLGRLKLYFAGLFG